LIDTNVHLSRWPFRRLTGDETPELVTLLKKKNVRQAWAGSFDGILHKDMAGVNARLAADCGKDGFLVPFGAINPRLPDWREDLRRCHEEHHMRGVRLYPNYHGYDLKAADFAEVAGAAARRRMVVQLVVAMQDERTQHPLVRVPPVNLAPLTDIVKSIAGLRLVILNYNPPVLAKQLAAAGQVYFDFAMLEGLGALRRLMDDVSPKRVLFGSHFPLFYFESAALKMKESGIDPAELDTNAASAYGAEPRATRA
jgi:predicted TIM-barrel fold metal-dependent hydrolase